MSQHENYFSGCSTSSVFPSPALSDAAFVHLSKGAHLDWFTSTFMYKLKFLAIVSVIWDFLLSISPFRSFFSYHLATQSSFPVLVSFLDLHQIDYSKTANQVYLSPALSNSTSPPVA